MDDPLIVGGVALIVGAVSLLIAGPLGMLVMGMILIFAGIVGPQTSETQQEIDERVNCPECGAVNSRSDEICYYCDASIEGQPRKG